MSLHELEPPDGIEPVSRANQAVAFAKISRSSFHLPEFTLQPTQFLTLRCRQTVTSDGPRHGPPDSAHFRIVVAVGSNSFANCSGLRPARTQLHHLVPKLHRIRLPRPPTVTPPLPQSGSVHQLGARSKEGKDERNRKTGCARGDECRHTPCPTPMDNACCVPAGASQLRLMDRSRQ